MINMLNDLVEEIDKNIEKITKNDEEWLQQPHADCVHTSPTKLKLKILKESILLFKSELNYIEVRMFSSNS